MTNDTGIKALVFDVFGTIVDWRGGVAQEAERLLKHYAPALDPFGFADAWRREYSPSMEEVRSGRRPYVRLDVLHRENLVKVLSRYGIAGVPDAQIDELNLAWHRLDPWPDSVEALCALKRKFIIAPLSNGNIRLMVDIAKPPAAE
jgi:2-haloacid dehalogenase